MKMGKELLYPKIETLFDRNPKTHKVILWKYRLEEFWLPKKWHVTEKIHGTNISVWYRWMTNLAVMKPTTMSRYIQFHGRTKNAQIPTSLLQYLMATFTTDIMDKTFPVIGEWEKDRKGEPPMVKVFGEGHGPSIQKGGGGYCDSPQFRVFDVWISDSNNPLGGWWLEPENVADIASKLGVKTAPSCPCNTIDDIVRFVKLMKKGDVVSSVAHDNGKGDKMPEGIVARTEPLLFTRKGRRLMFKLKVSDF